MRSTGMSFAARRAIQQSTFSSFLSSKRLERIQSLLRDSSIDALLAILGIDSRYNEGCRQLANYLLFGFYNLSLEEFNEVEISEEEVEDLVILVRQTSVSVYCCSSLYHYILPYITHWKNAEIHCLQADDQDEIDEDEKEEFKIRSMVSMLHGLSNIAVPYSTGRRSTMLEKSGATFSPLMIEKWPLIQSYALEGVGKGHFFTMQFNVTNLQDELALLYEECDPGDLEKILIQSLPLLERHWNETVDFVRGTNNANKDLQVASLELTETEVAESLLSYFNHGRLSAAYQHESVKISNSVPSNAKPFVCFGARSQQFAKQAVSSTATLQTSGTKRHALHMIIQGVAPRRPLYCCRTYFLSASDPEGKRDLDLLVNLYTECVRAAKQAISEYNKTCNAVTAFNAAMMVLSAARSRYSSSSTSGCKLEFLNNSGRVVRTKKSNPLSYIKKIVVSISDIKNADGGLLGAVCYGDTFVNSKLRLRTTEAKGDLYDIDGIVLTSAIPTYVQWQVGSRRLAYDASPSMATIPGVYVCSNSPIFGNKSCDLEVFSDGSLIVRHQRIAPFLLPRSAIDALTCHKPEIPNTVALLHVIFKPQAKLPGLLGANAAFALAFYPQTTAWKIFSNVVEGHLKNLHLLSNVDHVATSLLASYNALQSSYNWFAGLIYRSNPKIRTYKVNQTSMSLQPQLIGFLRHYSASFVLSDQLIPAEDIAELLGKDEGRADNVVSVAAQPKDAKVCVTVVCGLPGSHADRLCASLVALHKEKVRWVVVRVQSRSGNACLVDEEHLQDQLAELVAKKRSARPGVAVSKRLRIILETVGFYDVSAVVSCVINHKEKSVREQMRVGTVTTCVEPLVCHIDHSWLFPNVLDQCADGVVSNIAFTGVLEDIKDKNLAVMQGMIRNVNHSTAFLLAPLGNVKRGGDFDRILSESSFETKENKATRYLSVPGLWNHTYVQPKSALQMCEVKLDFSQPLLKGTLCARLRALRHNLHPNPFTGNVYMVQGIVRFTEPTDAEEDSNLCFVTRTGYLDIEARVTSGITPAPPKGRNAPAVRPFHLRFYGVALSEDTLCDWLRKSGRQAPSKKSHRSRESLSQGERKKIQVVHQQDSLPEGVFFNGSQYCSLADNSRSFKHPCIETFIDDYLRAENEKIDSFNEKLEAQMLPDMFAPLK